MNQNIVNQLNIDLPPPVPGRKRRTVSEKAEYNMKVSICLLNLVQTNIRLDPRDDEHEPRQL